MKREKRIIYILLIAMLLTVSALPPLAVKAGTNITILDESSLDSSKWSNSEEDVLIEEGILTFPENSTEYTRFISKTIAKADEKYSQMVTMSASVNFSRLPVGKSFIFAFGLSSIEAMPGEAGNIEVTFINDGGIKVGITAYDQDGNAIVVAKPKSCGMSLKKAADVKVIIGTDNTITVSVSGQVIYSCSLPTSGEGRVGFLQTGECGVTLDNLEVIYYQYDRPENTNISEDFEEGALDISVLTAKAFKFREADIRGQVVEEYNGSQVLNFHNVSYAYVGTLYQYSNFEMTFDIPYLRTEREFNEDGVLQEDSQTIFLISFGAEVAECNDFYDWESSSETLVFDATGVYSYNYPEIHSGSHVRNLFTEGGRASSVKVTVVDGVITVGMKWMEESKFQTVLTYELKNGISSGYVQIWALERANFAIDNLVVTNLDETPNTIETEYISGDLEVEDAVYVAEERVYAANQEVEESSNPIYLLIPVTTMIGVVALTISFIVARKKGIKKEATTYEE